MSDAKFVERSNDYFSGQGVVMIGRRNPTTGKPYGLRTLGNCTDLKISVATTVIQHKNSQDGQRGVDKRLQTETNCSLSMTIDNWNKLNLALATRGSTTAINAGAANAETVQLYGGLVTPLQFINLTQPSFVLTAQAGGAMTEYTNDQTPWDYRINYAAGSVQGNDGSLIGPVKSGGAVTGITVGNGTVIAVANNAQVGDPVRVFGATGADAAFINGVLTRVTVAAAGALTVDLNTTGKVITVGAGTVALSPGVPAAGTATYNYGNSSTIDALTQPLNDLYMRFEGLNTADNNNAVIVEVFKFSSDPLKELALISDTFGAFEIEGSVLADGFRQDGTSRYFNIRKL